MATVIERILVIGIAILAISTTRPATADTTDVELYAQQPIMAGPRLSPDGTRVAFLSSLEGRYHIVIERFKPEFTRVIIPPIEGLNIDWVRWANDDRVLFAASFPARRGLTETTETRLFSASADALDLVHIIKPATRSKVGTRFPEELPSPQIQDRIVDLLPNDRNHILVALDSDFDNYDEVRRIDIRDGDYEEVLGDFAEKQNWLTDTAGRIRLGWGDDPDDFEIAVQDTDGRWSSTTDKEWLRQEFRPLAFTDDPNVLLAKGPNDAGLMVIRKVDLNTGEFLETIFEHNSIDVDGVIVDQYYRTPIGITYSEHSATVEYLDEELRKLQATLDRALPTTTNRITSTSQTRRQLLIFSSSDTNPGAYYLWDRDLKDLSHYSDYLPGVNENNLSAVKPVSYAARDGLVIPAYLTIPRGADPDNLPTIILPHGGPHARDDKSYWFLSQFLASQGYAVFQPNFRGSSGYGDSFREAGRNEWGGKMQDDVTDGTRWLIEEGITDPARVCIVGWSYGGYAAAMGAVKTPDLYRCAASINGVLNLPRLISDDKKYFGGREWTEHMGLEGERSKSVSPYHQAERITIPMLIIQSEDDARIHNDQGREMAKQLRKLGKPVEYVEIEFGGHSMLNVDGRIQILESLEAFLAKNLGSAAP